MYYQRKLFGFKEMGKKLCYTIKCAKRWKDFKVRKKIPQATFLEEMNNFLKPKACVVILNISKIKIYKYIGPNFSEKFILQLYIIFTTKEKKVFHFWIKFLKIYFSFFISFVW